MPLEKNLHFMLIAIIRNLVILEFYGRNKYLKIQLLVKAFVVTQIIP